jgi:hypothetical protein
VFLKLNCDFFMTASKARQVRLWQRIGRFLISEIVEILNKSAAIRLFLTTRCSGGVGSLSLLGLSFIVISTVVDDCMDAGGRVTQEQLPRDLYWGMVPVLNRRSLGFARDDRVGFFVFGGVVFLLVFFFTLGFASWRLTFFLQRKKVSKKRRPGLFALRVPEHCETAG